MTINHSNTAVIWDWNGTVVNDCFVFVEILNILLKKNNLSPITTKEYRASFCFPIKSFYKQIGLYKNEQQFKTLNQEFVLLYEKKMFLPPLIKEIKALIFLFQKKKINQYIVSAQHQKTLKTLVDFYGLGGCFQKTLGVNNNHARGKKKLTESLKKELINKNIFFVGDTFLDFKAAGVLGAECFLVDWGHYNKSRLMDFSKNVFSSVNDLKVAILSQNY